jgi:DNA-binding GntR family transcriptional regulator
MQNRTQAETAHHELKHRILIWELAPGLRLKEEEWAKKLQVSRAAIRECLTRLLGEGLVSAGARGGFFVAETTLEDMRQLKQLREILETAAFSLACQFATDAQIQEIEATCDDHARMVLRGYVIGALEVDRHFHQLLMAASGNPRLERAYNNSNIPVFHMKIGRANLSQADLVETEKQHRAIAAALRERDSAKGIKLLKAHFNRGEIKTLGN